MVIMVSARGLMKNATRAAVASRKLSAAQAVLVPGKYQRVRVEHIFVFMTINVLCQLLNQTQAQLLNQLLGQLMIQTHAISRLAAFARILTLKDPAPHNVSAASAFIAMTRRTPRPANTRLRDHRLSIRRRRIVLRNTTGRRLPPQHLRANARGSIMNATRAAVASRTSSVAQAVNVTGKYQRVRVEHIFVSNLCQLVALSNGSMRSEARNVASIKSIA